MNCKRLLLSMCVFEICDPLLYFRIDSFIEDYLDLGEKTMRRFSSTLPKKHGSEETMSFLSRGMNGFPVSHVPRQLLLRHFINHMYYMRQIVGLGLKLNWASCNAFQAVALLCML